MTSATPIPPAWLNCARTSVTIYGRRVRCVATPSRSSSRPAPSRQSTSRSACCSCVDAQGLVVDAGLRKAPRARAAFVTPSHQFPTGVALSMARRLERWAWVRQSGAFIVEDDYTSEFRYSGPPLASLQGLDDTEQVIYVGTLNKALFPGLRIGYAVVPRALLQAFI